VETSYLLMVCAQKIKCMLMSHFGFQSYIVADVSMCCPFKQTMQLTFYYEAVNATCILRVFELCVSEISTQVLNI